MLDIPPRVLKILFVLGILNFVAFVAVSRLIGGDAANGYMEHGHYFLKDHSRITEVSSSVFEYSRWHARSLMITHPMAMLSALLLYFISKNKPEQNRP